MCACVCFVSVEVDKQLIFFMIDRIHTACSAELLILEWLSAVIMRGILSFIFIH